MGYVYNKRGTDCQWGMCIKQARDRLLMWYVFKTSKGQTVEWGMCVKQARDSLLNGVCV